MKKKSKIKIATFWGLIFATMGVSNSGANSSSGMISTILVRVVIPLIGVGLLTYVAGELYSSKK